MNLHFRRDVADEGDGAALAYRVNGGGDGLGAADRFEDDVGSEAAGLVEDFAREIGAGEMEGLVNTEGARQVQAGIVDVGDEDACGAGSACGLHGEQSD